MRPPHASRPPLISDLQAFDSQLRGDLRIRRPMTGPIVRRSWGGAQREDFADFCGFKETNKRNQRRQRHQRRRVSKKPKAPPQDKVSTKPKNSKPQAITKVSKKPKAPSKTKAPKAKANQS